MSAFTHSNDSYHRNIKRSDNKTLYWARHHTDTIKRSLWTPKRHRQLSTFAVGGISFCHFWCPPPSHIRIFDGCFRPIFVRGRCDHYLLFIKRVWRAGGQRGLLESHSSSSLASSAAAFPYKGIIFRPNDCCDGPFLLFTSARAIYFSYYSYYHGRRGEKISPDPKKNLIQFKIKI